MISRFLLLVLLLVSLNSNAGSWSDWTTEDKSLMKTYVVLNVIDVAQTHYIIKNGGVEHNPLLGNSPSAKDILQHKLVGLGIIYLFTDIIEDNRREFLITINAVQLLVISNNLVVMLQFD